MNPLRIAILLVAALTLPASNVAACFNQFDAPEQFGDYVRIEGKSPSEFIERFTEFKGEYYWDSMAGPTDTRLGPVPRLRSDNQRAVALAHLGRVRESLDILEKLEAEEPGAYATASNLGTSYELSGQNEKALEWIREGMRRNPGSHYGTEWLHVKILEAKIALAKEPDWLARRGVLGLDDALPVTPETRVDFEGAKLNIAEVEKALIYQLHERLQFVRPPDPTVADLLVDLGRILSVTRTPEHAARISALAAKYGSATNNRREAKVADATRSSLLMYAGAGAVFLALLAGAAFILARRRETEASIFND